MKILLATCLLVICSCCQAGRMDSNNLPIDGKGDKNETSEIQEIKDDMMKMKKIIDTLKDENEKIIKDNKDLIKVSVLRSCAEYSRYGLQESGEYMIDPDGKGQGQEPFQVFCNFSSGATEVMHSSEKNGPIQIVDQCDGPGCYHKNISYINGLTAESISMNQISSLIELAHHCEQQFRFDCKLVPLNGSGSNFAWWEGRYGKDHTYFTGKHYGCDCHPEYPSIRYPSCNDGTGWFYGNITDMSALPIMKMYFGGFGNEKGVAFQFSRLKCYGEKDVQTSISCSSLKKEGVRTSGYYNIKPLGSKHVKLVFCDMKTDTYNDVLQIEESDGFPLGTISAWVSKPAGDGSPEQLPDGWVLCDGSLIEKGSWAGARTPDLNSGHFLRGGNLGQQLEMEADQLQDHMHTDPGHSHSASSSSSASPHSHSYSDQFNSDNDSGPSKYCDSYPSSGCTDWDSRDTSSSTSGSTTVSVSTSTSVTSHSTGISGVTSSYRHGAETRPKNMKVSWIMKCW